MLRYLLFVIFLFRACASLNTINLNTTNFLTIRGSIDSTTSSKFIYELNKKKKKNETIVFIDSPGGSVESGNHIIMEIQKYNLSCIANRAYRMGFVILQSCNKRYMTQYGKLMQHQISYGIMDEKEKIESYVNYISQMDGILTDLQANKLNITSKLFKEKTYNEWWLFGQYAITNNCVDELVHVTCDNELTKKNDSIKYTNYEKIYSKCPLIELPLDTINFASKNFDFFTL